MHTPMTKGSCSVSVPRHSSHGTLIRRPKVMKGRTPCRTTTPVGTRMGFDRVIDTNFVGGGGGAGVCAPRNTHTSVKMKSFKTRQT